MFNILVVLIAGSIVVSFFQGMRRSKSSPEELKNNSTLLETMADLAKEASTGSRKLLEQTNFELKHCAWFPRFERSVGSKLDLAEQFLEIEESLEADPKLKEMYNRIRPNTNGDAIANLPPPRSEQEWLKNGPPSAPEVQSDPEINRVYQGIFQRHIDRHREFVDDVRERLRRKPLLRKHFSEMMVDSEDNAILEKYFPDEAMPKPKP